MWEVRVDGATEAGKPGPVPEVWFLRSFSVHPGRVPIMTASAKEVIAPREIIARAVGRGAFEDSAQEEAEWQNWLPEADAAIAALHEAGYVVVPKASAIPTSDFIFGAIITEMKSDGTAKRVAPEDFFMIAAAEKG